MIGSGVWDDLAGEFRALGGILDNVRLGEGPLGRGLFAIDASRPALIRVPENLLVNISDIAFRGGAPKILPAAALPPRQLKFYEDYYASLSWGGGGQAEILRVFEEAQALPADLRHKLASHYRCGSWFEEPAPGLLTAQFLETRAIAFKDRYVMAPFVELANNGEGLRYERGDGLAIGGAVQDEITVRYSNLDPHGVFQSWGFAAEQPVAYSLELNLEIGGRPLQIECIPEGAIGAQPPLPKLSFGGGTVNLSFCLLGNRKFPRLCRGQFRQVLRQAGFHDVDEAFDRLQQTNQAFFLSLIQDIEPLDGPMVGILRRMARFQLQALSHCYGAREAVVRRAAFATQLQR